MIFLSDQLLSVLIGGAIGVLGTVLGTVITQRGSRVIKGSELRQKEYQAKRDVLTDVYKSLITIINLYPDESPNDIVRCTKYPPYYSSESYDATFSTLEIQLEDYIKKLSFPNIDYQRKNEIEIEVININYAKRELISNRDSYFKAKKAYLSFVESTKTVFDLYANQNIKNCLVIFEVAINNIFIAGNSTMNHGNQDENIIRACRRELIHAMRDDIGIF